MTLLEFFGGIFNFPVNKEIIESACVMRTFNGSDDINEVDRTIRELILADILIILSRASQGYQERTGSDTFSMMVKGEKIALADRQAMRQEANAIYRRHCEFENIVVSNAINI